MESESYYPNEELAKLAARERRELAGILSELAVALPELSARASSRIHRLDLGYELRIVAGDRGCTVVTGGEEIDPECCFTWDSGEMFGVRTSDLDLLARLLRRWLFDVVPPSAVKAEFATVEMSPYARYYEEGRPVEGEFLCSWDWMERFYRDDLKALSGSAPMLQLLSQLRQAGYDRSLRAGQSMHILILSRSRRHGLRSRQPSVAIQMFLDFMRVDPSFGLGEAFNSKEIALVPELERVLQRLLAEPIT